MARKIIKSTNVYGSQSVLNPPTTFKGYMVQGKKDRGWNLKNSDWKISMILVYHLYYKASQEICETQRFRHSFTIKHKRFSGNFSDSLLLELAGKLNEAEAKDMQKLSQISIPPNYEWRRADCNDTEPSIIIISRINRKNTDE